MRLASAALLGLGVAIGCRETGSHLRPRPDAPASSVASAVPPAPPPKGASSAQSPVPGDEIRIRAKHPSGAPLHPEPESSKVSGRLADGSVARVERVKDGRWFEVSQGAERGWLTRRYLSLGPEPRPTLAEGSPFASREACLAALERQERVERAPAVARIGSWNLHWFPDGKPGRGESGAGSDLRWLACVVAYLDLDVLAAQELKGTERARRAMNELTSHLDRHTKGKWQVLVDDCPESNGQHVAVLYDSKRARRLGGATLAELNPHGEPCKDQLRPGIDAYLGFPGGLDVHVVSVHLKAGGKPRDLALRRRSFESFSEAFDAAQKIAADPDVLVLGDLNTMGCPDCSPPLSSAAELAELAPLLEREGFRKLESDVGCTYHFNGSGTLLDGAGVSRSFAEAEGVTVRVAGPCAELGCERAPERHPARSLLSDHCPIVVDIPDRDLD